MANTATNVTSGKPSINGAIFVAPIGTALPTDATTALNQAFKALGYCSTDGLVNSNSTNSNAVGAWGGDNPLTLESGSTDTFKYQLLEVLNVDVLKFVYGEDNVTGTLATGITVKVNNKEKADHVIVVEMIMRGGVLKRIVMPIAKIITLGDIIYKDDSAVYYDVTVSCANDASGQSHYEYIKQPSQQSQG